MAREMKESGIEWIGEIPKDWKIISFWQAIQRMATGLNPRDNFELTKEDKLFYVTIRNFKDGILYLDDDCDRISQEAWDIIQERSQLQKGDILFASISKKPYSFIRMSFVVIFDFVTVTLSSLSRWKFSLPSTVRLWSMLRT